MTMHKDWQGIATERSGAIKEVRLGAPDVMEAYSSMVRAATHEGPLDPKTKNLIARAISL